MAAAVTDELALENLERQIDELEALELVLGDGEGAATLEITAPRAVERAKMALAAGAGSSFEAVGEIALKVAVGTSTLFVSMPSAYPSHAPLELSCSADSPSKTERLLEVARQATEEAGEGAESALAAIQAFADAAQACDEEDGGPAAASDSACEAGGSGGAERATAAAAAVKAPLRLAGPGEGWLDISPGDLEDSGLPAAARVWRGPELLDRKSVFQAFAMQATCRADAAGLVRLLLRDRRVAKATHNMMAYRVVRAEDGLVLSDNDEDGESGAGARMSHLLELMGVDNAVVVVSRWFGGVLLGPKRFAHISNCTREALEQAGLFRKPSA